MIVRIWKALDTEPGTLADDVGVTITMIAAGALFYFIWGITP